MAEVIDPTRDLTNLQTAIEGLLEEEFAFSRVRRSLERAEEGDREHIFESLPERVLSPAYYMWAEYLVWLEARMEIARWEKLQVCEAEGLMTMGRARSRFEHNHPECACGARLESRFVPSCPSCGLELRRPGGNG